MKNTLLYTVAIISLAILNACQPNSGGESSDRLKIAYVNGDSILNNYAEFRQAAEGIDAKQREAEQQIQVKMEALEKQIQAYQRKAQAGTMSPREMQSEEQRLGGMQQELQMESEALSRQLMSETSEINDRLQKLVKDKLREIKDKEGYDFILNSMEGGPILIADEEHDITQRVLDELNAGGAAKQDTSGN